MKIKLLKGSSTQKLESEVNEFIQNKKIIDIKVSNRETTQGTQILMTVMYE